MKQFRRSVALGSLVLMSLAATRPCAARFAYSGQPVPVERLVTNVGKFVTNNPKDAQGHYTLGRIHSLAFVRGLEPVNVSGNITEGKTLPNFPPYESIQQPRQSEKQPSHQELTHLTEALRSYQTATELDPKKSLYWLGFAWTLEQGTPYARRVALRFKNGDTLRSPDAWREHALTAYRKAYRLDLEGDLKSGRFRPGADSAVSLEAGEGILRLLASKRRNAAEEAEVEVVKKTVDRLKNLPRAVTPIIFPLDDPAASLPSLLTDGPTVIFDLAADTRSERWPWVNARAGILVWDPARSGRITSGAQLFGTATWSMFWPNGYEPLAALDDNGDDWLSGKELEGLAVWHDRNGNAVSDTGEVHPISTLNVKRLAVRAAGHPGGSPYHPRGIERNDGTYLPTYDWMPTSIPVPRPLK